MCTPSMRTSICGQRPLTGDPEGRTALPKGVDSRVLRKCDCRTCVCSLDPRERWSSEQTGRSRSGGGRSGIRTHGGPKTSTAFEAVPFVRSGILPGRTLLGAPRDNPADGCARSPVRGGRATVTGLAWQRWGSGPDVFVVPPLSSHTTSATRLSRSPRADGSLSRSPERPTSRPRAATTSAWSDRIGAR